MSTKHSYGVVYNNCEFGYFQVNDEIFNLYKKYGGIEKFEDKDYIDRTELALVKAVKRAKNTDLIRNNRIISSLSVKYINNLYNYIIYDRDGAESVLTGKIKGCLCECNCLSETSSNEIVKQIIQENKDEQTEKQTKIDNKTKHKTTQQMNNIFSSLESEDD